MRMSAMIDLDSTILVIIHYLGGLLWSVFTLLTPLASGKGLIWMILARIALGLGEGRRECEYSCVCGSRIEDTRFLILLLLSSSITQGVAYPSVHAMIGTWIPPNERSKAVATITAFAYSGSVIALPISSALVVSSWGWRSVFWVFGTLGLTWSVIWQVLTMSALVFLH